MSVVASSETRPSSSAASAVSGARPMPTNNTESAPSWNPNPLGERGPARLRRAPATAPTTGNEIARESTARLSKQVSRMQPTWKAIPEANPTSVARQGTVAVGRAETRDSWPDARPPRNWTRRQGSPASRRGGAGGGGGGG